MSSDASVSKASDLSNIFKSSEDRLPRTSFVASTSSLCPVLLPCVDGWSVSMVHFLPALVTQLIIIVAVCHSKGTYVRKNVSNLSVFCQRACSMDGSPSVLLEGPILSRSLSSAVSWYSFNPGP
ncbi:hypothetical protein DFH08DRAFT_1086020 [Mycena albidolilacea]|uniref:Uncharacterized protein n=1 Tax=Mycena albidolilacea TaxID=1033008 RepID=A0AAD6ZGH4_9AGAR|nr:hypothetical protein DFH08DRAFT_1086020 [Mycena albidolilacea]